MGYLLDTNSVIAVIAQADRRVMQHLAENRADCALSAIVLHELQFGAFNSSRVEDNLAAVAEIGLPILAFDADDAFAAAEIRARLRRAGSPIGPYDVLIAGQALARDLTVVTANQREFSRVDGLRLENWVTR